MASTLTETNPTAAGLSKSEVCGAQEHADPRVRRTRKLLQDAFRSLIHEKRFSDISVQHITERATVNRATFYAHYVDKQDLAISVVKADLSASIREIFSQKPGFTRDNLIMFSTAVFEFIGNLHSGCSAKGESDMPGALAMCIQDELYAIVYGWLGHSRTYIQMFPESSRETVASVISSSVFGAAHRWVRTSRRESAKDVCREIVAVLVRE